MSRISSIFASSAGGALAVLCSIATGSAAETVSFKGQTVSVVVTFEAGGPYDLYGRLVSRYIGSHLPGDPQVIVRNMPGAGGMVGANHLYNVAPRDGTILGVPSQKVAVGQLLEQAKGIKYDARKFTWVGRLTSNVELLHSWTASGFTSIDVAWQREVVVAGTGPTSSSVVFPRLMNDLIGTKFKVVTGYKGPASAQISMERGEVEGIVKPWSSIKATTPEWLREKKITPIVQYTQQRHPELADVPAVVDLAKNDEQRRIFALFASGASLGTSVVAPPLPAPIALAVRKAFSDTMKDPAFLEEVRKAGVDLDPLPGEDLQKVVESTFDIPASIVKRARELSLP